MMRYFWLFVLCQLVPACVVAQALDTVHLKEVVVYGMPVSQYAAGTKVMAVTASNETDLLAKVIQDKTPAYFKNYGNSQLSTIAFRGTSASHTAVLWNGVNISLPSLGQTDFSLLPSYLLEDIAVQYGTSSTLYGSEALGGSIILAPTKPKFSGDTRFSSTLQAGSFGRAMAGLKATYGSDKMEFRTKTFYSQITNNFPYTAPELGYSKNQNDASVDNYGFDQQIHIKVTTHQQLSVEGMYTHNFRHIQPVVTHDTPAGTLLDKNGRVALTYRNDARVGVIYAALAYINNYELYGDTSAMQANQLNSLVNIDSHISPTINIRYGASTSTYFANTPDYAGRISETRFDGFISYEQIFSPRVTVSANLRQSVYAGKTVPFTPSIGSEFLLARSAAHRLLLRAQASRGYRIPTLNDRYWIPGGNPDLKPEDAFHAEAGLQWKHEKDRRQFSIEVTTFHTWVKEWILWLPGTSGIWSPSNLQQVYARGVEASLQYARLIGEMNLTSGLNYSYTRSENQVGLSATDTQTEGKQLPYVPLHNGNMVIKANYHRAWLQARASYTSRRFIALDNEVPPSLDPYALLDMQAGWGFSHGKSNSQISLDANNLFNTYYEMNKGYAMPGRNFTITLTIHFNNIKTP